MRTVAITGAASGIGRATTDRLAAAGCRVIGVDVRDAEIIADLGRSDGCRDAAAAISDACHGVLDGLVTCAGVGGLPDRAGSLLVDVNYLGTVELATALRPALAAARSAAVVLIGSNSTTIQPGIPRDVVDACLAGDRDRAAALADEAGAVATYPATKLAVSRWARRHAPHAEWIGAGIRVNVAAPGMIETALVAEQRADPGMAPLLDLLPIPVGRPGRPEEIAALIEFLVGPASSFLCGSIILADGGSEALLRPDDWPAPWALDVHEAHRAFGAG